MKSTIYDLITKGMTSVDNEYKFVAGSNEDSKKYTHKYVPDPSDVIVNSKNRKSLSIPVWSKETYLNATQFEKEIKKDYPNAIVIKTVTVRRENEDAATRTDSENDTEN